MKKFWNWARDETAPDARVLRLEGTIATTVAGVLRGAAFVRVHDVKENLRAARMALAIRREAGFDARL